MVTISVYLDESSGEYPYLASGWAARPEDWERVSESWQRALNADRKLSHFKLNDALGLKGPFSGWTEEDRDAKLIALARTIPHDGTVFGIGCHIRREHFESVKNEIPRRILRDPYYFCIATSMIFSAGSEMQIVGVDKLDFILDQSKAAERMRKLFYSSIKPAFPKLGECSIADDKKTLPLQAADLSAGMTRQLYEPCPRRIPGSYAWTGLFSGILEVNEKGLRDAISSPLIRGLDAKPSPR